MVSLSLMRNHKKYPHGSSSGSNQRILFVQTHKRTWFIKLVVLRASNASTPSSQERKWALKDGEKLARKEKGISQETKKLSLMPHLTRLVQSLSRLLTTSMKRSKLARQTKTGVLGPALETNFSWTSLLIGQRVA